MPPGSASQIFPRPAFNLKAIVTIAPIAVILVAEEFGHLKALSAMVGRNFDPYIGRAFIGDGIATMVAASAGGSGVTTYAKTLVSWASRGSIPH